MRRNIRKFRKEARLAIKAANRILKKWRKRLVPSQRELLAGTVRELQEAILQDDLKRSRPGLKKLNNLLESDFTFARKSTAREWTESIAFALILVFVIRTFVVQPFKIPTGSMEPTLLGVKKECPFCHEVYRYYNKFCTNKFCSQNGSRLQTVQTGDKILVNKFLYGAKTPDRIPFTTILLPYLQLPAIRSPRRGDIVVFHYPKDLRKDYVKRLVGLPGETIEIKDNKILINGGLVSTPEMEKVNYTNLEPFGRRGQKVTIPSPGLTIPLNLDWIWYWEQLIRNDGHTLEIVNRQILIDGKPRREYTVEQNYYYFLGDNSSSSQDSRVWGFVPEKNIVGEVFFIYWPPRRWGLVH